MIANIKVTNLRSYDRGIVTLPIPNRFPLTMRFIIYFLLLPLAPACFAQTGWFELHPSVPGTYTDIAFLSADAGFLVTDNPAKAYQTLDGGSQWHEISLPSCSNCTYHFEHLFFADKTTGYIIGKSDDGITSKNLLFKTTNSGILWLLDTSLTPHPFPFPAPSQAVAYRTEQNHFEKTVDSGKSWLVTDTLDDTNGKYVFDFRNENNGIRIVTAGDPLNTVVEVSKDEGANWSYSRLQYIYDYTEAYQTVKALPNNIYLVGGEYIFRSLNNGSSWSQVSSYHAGEFTFFDSLIGYAPAGYYSHDGYILHTVDGGLNWKVEPVVGRADSWQRISAPSELTAYALVNASQLFKTIDGGEGSQSIVKSTDISLSSLTMKNDIVTSLADFQFSAHSDPQALFIYDLLGRLMLQEQTNADQTSLQVNVQGFQSGVYFARLGSSVLRFVKM